MLLPETEILSANTESRLQETEVLSPGTEILSPETEILSPETELLSTEMEEDIESGATTVLGEAPGEEKDNSVAPLEFKVIKNVVITHTNETL